jgi:hypothetical protein
VLSFLRGEDKHEMVSEGCAAIRRGELTGKTLGIALVPVPGGAMPSGAPRYRERRVR